LREEHTLKVFDNRVLRRLSGPKRDEVIGGWRKLYNEELYNLYSSPNIIKMITLRRMRWTGQVARIGEKRTAYSVLVGKRGGLRRKWKNNIKMNLRDIGWGVWTGIT
jgi:hypothetical protein